MVFAFTEYLMLLITGNSYSEKRLGYAADYCPICRALSPVLVTRIANTSHLYFVPIGTGKTLAFTGKCHHCQTIFPVEAMRYDEIMKHPAEVNALIHCTLPDARSIYSDELKLADRIVKQPASLSQSERDQLLEEPFLIYRERIESVFGGGSKLDKSCGMIAIGTTLLIVLLTYACFFFEKDSVIQQRCIILIPFVLTLGCFTCLIQYARIPGKFVKQRAIPAMVRSLKPLNPSKGELNSILGKLRRSGDKIGKKVKIDHLWNALQ